MTHCLPYVLKKSSLSLAVIGSLFAVAQPASGEARQLRVSDGQEHTATGTYDTRELGNYASSLVAYGANTVIHGQNAALLTDGINAYGAFALGGGRVTVDRFTSVRTAGQSSSAVYSQQGRMEVDGSTIETSGDESSGAVANLGGTLAVGGGAAITTTGYQSDGVFVIGAGSRADVADATIHTSGYQSRGLVSGTGALLNATNVQVSTLGELSSGAVAAYGAAITLRGGAISTEGLSARGVVSSGDAQIEGVAITTKRGHGLEARGESTSSIKARNVNVRAETGHGAFAIGYGNGQTPAASITIEDSAITTGSSHALHAQDGGRIYVKGSTVSTTGPYAHGLNIAYGQRVDSSIVAQDSYVVTQGSAAVGASANVGRIELSDSKVETQGQGATGVSVEENGVMLLSNTNVTTQGEYASAAEVWGSLSMIGGRLHGQNADAINTGGNATIELRDGAQVIGGNGTLVSVGRGDVSIRAGRGVYLEGDVADDEGFDLRGRLRLSLEDGAAWKGAVGDDVDGSLDAAASQWTLTGDSSLSALNLTDSVVTFQNAEVSDFTPKVLEVRGDYVGDGARMVLNTRLGDDSSATDRLVVKGSTSGDTFLTVNNIGGAGAATNEGIQVVQVDGASQGRFALSGRVIAGANEYLLAQGGKSTPTDGDWYLRSEAPSVIVPPVVDPPAVVQPVTPVDPAPVVTAPVKPTPTTPVYRPEIGAYLGNQHAAVTMFSHTMHDRVGQPTFADDGRSDGRGGAAWVRFGSSQFDATSGARQVDSATNTDVLQLGGEVVSWTAGDSRFHVGAMGGWGRANSHVGSELTGYSAKGRVTGYNLGVYGTWFANAGSGAGLYVDGSVQGGRFSNRVEGDYLPRESYDSQSMSASIEGGYAIALLANETTELYLQPQAQMIYTGYKADRHVESNGTVFTSEDAGGWTSRVGARLYGNAAGAGINRIQPFLELNWWHADEGDSIALGGQRVDWDLPQDVYEAKLGAQIELGAKWSGWGNIGAQSGAGEFRTVDGQVGLMRRW